MTNEITDQYAAAWIEARGQVQTNVGGVGRSRPQVRVTALDPAVPDALAEYFGLGKTDTFNPRTAPRLTLYVWQVRGKAAAYVLERTVPYMVSEMRRDCEYILERTRTAQSYDGDVLVLFDRLEPKHASSLRSESAV
jgi:hypothetical protein